MAPAANLASDFREVNRTDCYLCDPKTELVFDKSVAGFAMVGLGPLVTGYTIVATQTHVMRLTELEQETLDAYLQYAERIRQFLEGRYGACLITEHGNTALCRGFSSEKGHSFHPHFLMFPMVPDIVSAAEAYFGHGEEAPSIADAIELGKKRQYLLISPRKGDYHIFFPQTTMPRQFARALVAEAIGIVELASWRDHPNIELAISYATQHRNAFTALGDR